MKQKHFDVVRWLPALAAFALLALIAVICAHTLSEINDDARWRENAFDAVLDAQAMEDTLIEAQQGERGYIQTGKPNLLVEFRSETNAEQKEFEELSALVSRQPDQAQRLKRISADIQALFARDSRVIGLYARQGTNAALRENASKENATLEAAAIHDLEQFTADEKKLLAKRDAAENSDYRRAARYLVIGSLAVACLLVLANYVAGREMARRRLAEEEQRRLIDQLQQALSEVKTLSGLIPICSWCKNVRSDSGYWQTVEQYVHAHTDATLTHGLCPTCATKMEESFGDSTTS